MVHWQILIIVGLLLVILEIFTPVLFFLNLALACFLTAIFALVITDWNTLVPVFVLLSALFLIFLRPLLVKTRTNGQKTGLEGKYIGKIAKVKETVTTTSGVVSIYDERWNARIESGEEIPVGTEVKIIRNESLLFYVEPGNDE